MWRLSQRPKKRIKKNRKNFGLLSLQIIELSSQHGIVLFFRPTGMTVSTRDFFLCGSRIDFKAVVQLLCRQAMAYAAAYPAGARDHVIEVSDRMLAEVDGRRCPQCDCRDSRPVNGGDDMPLRVCSACDEVYGFDDSTNVPDHLLPKTSPPGAGIWDNQEDDEPVVYPRRQSSPCFRDARTAADYSSENDDEEAAAAEDRDQEGHHLAEEKAFSTDASRSGRGGGRGRRGGGGGHGRGRGHQHYHHGEDRSRHCQQHYHHHQHHAHCGRGRGQRGRGGNSTHGGGGQSSSKGSDPWTQLGATCLKLTSCAMNTASDVIAGRYDRAMATVSDQMEPIGRAFGSAIGSTTGELIGSPRAGEICADMGSTVGRGMAEMLKESSLCSRRSPTQHD